MRIITALTATREAKEPGNDASRSSTCSCIVINSLPDWAHTSSHNTDMPRASMECSGQNEQESPPSSRRCLQKPRDPHVWCVWPCHLAWLNVSTLFLIPLISRGGCQLLFLALVERRLPSECLSDQLELNCSIENFIGFELCPLASIRTKCKVGVLFSSPFYWIFQDRLRNKGIKLNRDKQPEKK